MAPRLELQEVLKGFVPNVYFQPPENDLIEYPCIVYVRDYIVTDHADDNPYNRHVRYLVTVIDPDPDSTIPDMVGNLPLCVFERFYTADKLNHDVFKLFF